MFKNNVIHPEEVVVTNSEEVAVTNSEEVAVTNSEDVDVTNLKSEDVPVTKPKWYDKMINLYNTGITVRELKEEDETLYNKIIGPALEDSCPGTRSSLDGPNTHSSSNGTGTSFSSDGTDTPPSLEKRLNKVQKKYEEMQKNNKELISELEKRNDMIDNYMLVNGNKFLEIRKKEKEKNLEMITKMKKFGLELELQLANIIKLVKRAKENNSVTDAVETNEVILETIYDTPVNKIFTRERFIGAMKKIGTAGAIGASYIGDIAMIICAVAGLRGGKTKKMYYKKNNKSKKNKHNYKKTKRNKNNKAKTKKNKR
jgi:hypothetical protein